MYFAQGASVAPCVLLADEKNLTFASLQLSLPAYQSYNHKERQPRGRLILLNNRLWQLLR